MNLDDLLGGAEDADGMRRIEFRDPIASFGELAVRRLEPWLSDPRLARFALLTIERAAVQPEVVGSARSTLTRARASCAESVREEIPAALARLGSSGRVHSPSVRSSSLGGPAIVVPVPPRLRQLVSEWRAAGSPPQPPILWPRDLWLTDLPKHSVLFRALPTLLARADIREVCADASKDGASAERALVAVMVWGQGSRGYGRYRTSHILSAPDAPDRLLSAVLTLAEDRPLAAYHRLAHMNDCGLDGLGAAFGTKYLYFCQRPGQPMMALILDKLVADWISRYAGLDFRSQPWSERRYEAYLRQMHAWAEELGCRPDELEQLIFQDQANDSGGQWSSSGAAVPRRPRRPSGGATDQLDISHAPTTVELRFHQAMLDVYELAGRQTGYWANYFLRSVRANGGLATARDLLWKSGTSKGFERLKKEGRLDLSMEAVMLRPEFRELFSAEEAARASERLAAHGFQLNHDP